MQLSYLDFELEIGVGQGRDFPVVARSPAGEARALLHFPFDELALESRLKDLQIALLRSGGNRRQALSSEQQTVLTFGQALFDALFSGEVRSRYDVSLQQARSQGKGLRIRRRPGARARGCGYGYKCNRPPLLRCRGNTSTIPASPNTAPCRSKPPWCDI